MFRFEEKIIEWIESKLYFFSITAITIIAVFIRYSLRDLESPDYLSFLKQWYYEIQQGGGLAALGNRVGNYNMLYQFLIAVLTYLPIKPLYAYKILSCVFDFLTAIAASLIVQQISGERCGWKSFAAYTLVLVSPIVFLNSAAWAQCDIMYSFFIIMAFLCLLNDKYALMMVLYGVSFALKFQAVVFLPFLLFVYFIRRKFSAIQFLWVPVSMVVTSIPCLLAGKDIREIYWVYMRQADQYCAVHMNYPSFWAILNSEQYTADWFSFKGMAISMTVVVLAVIMIALYKVKLEHINLLYIAFLLSYAAVLLLPSMHERYGFLYEILAILIVVLNKKTAPLFAALLYISCCTYGRYLYGTAIDIGWLAAINVSVFLLYVWILVKEMENKNGTAGYVKIAKDN